eukprot:m.252292 g.252292  ORF g.252292 m.252292 type:complete len:69 (-) comp33902_c0_seq23:143-349(-)
MDLIDVAEVNDLDQKWLIVWYTTPHPHSIAAHVLFSLPLPTQSLSVFDLHAIICQVSHNPLTYSNNIP